MTPYDKAVQMKEKYGSAKLALGVLKFFQEEAESFGTTLPDYEQVKQHLENML